MGEFELSVGVMHISLLNTHKNPLEHACNRFDSTTATGWINCQSNTRLALAGALFRQLAFVLCDYTFTASVSYIIGDSNILADSTSRK